MRRTVTTTSLGLLLVSPAIGASLDYGNSGEIVLSVAQPEVVVRKPLRLPAGTTELAALRPALYCRVAGADGRDRVSWAVVRCAMRLVDAAGVTRWNRSIWAHEPSPDMDVLGGVPAAGLSVEWACEALEDPSDPVTCNGTWTVVGE